MDRLKLLLPPALVFALFGGAMYLLDRWLPVGEFDFTGREGLTIFLTGLAVVVGLLAVVSFIRKGTTTDPMHPEKAKHLVTSGIYQYSRNPMYLALLLVLLAWGLKLGNAFNTLLAAGFVAYMNRFQIRPEEEEMLRKFGSAYKQYCTLVRRWF